MSQESVDLFKRAVDAMNRKDLDCFVALMDDQVEAVPRIAAMEGVYRGPDGIRRWWNGLFGAFPDLTVEVAEVSARSDLTFAALHLRGRGAGSDTPVDEAVWHLAWWHHGKCTQWSIHSDHDQALEAVRLAE